VTGLPLAARVVPASTAERIAVEMLLDDMDAVGRSDRLELVMVDRGTSVKAARAMSAKHGVEVRRIGWDQPQLDGNGRKVFRPIAHAWRVEVAHGTLGWSRRLSKSFENTTLSATGWLQLACLVAVLDVLR